MTVDLQTSVSGARLALADRLLMLGTADDVRANMPHIDRQLGGAVVLGAQASATVRRLRNAFPDLFILEQPTGHMERAATATEPFVLSRAASNEMQPTLFDVEPATLGRLLDAQIANGASLGILPTGFIEANDVMALRATLEAANKIDRSDTILHLPLSHVWISGAGLEKVIAFVNRSIHPVAISLANRGDPGSQSGVVDGLRRLFREAPDASLWFTDLCGIDAIAHGALAAAVGLAASHRHIVDPKETAYSPRPHDRSPNVLMRDLLSYHKSRHMHENWYASTLPPTCDDDECCDGGALDRFTGSTADRNAGHRHNSIQLKAMQRSMMASTSRADWWADRIKEAEFAHLRLAVHTGLKNIKPAGAVKRWIELNSAYETEP